MSYNCRICVFLWNNLCITCSKDACIISPNSWLKTYTGMLTCHSIIKKICFLFFLMFSYFQLLLWFVWIIFVRKKFLTFSMENFVKVYISLCRFEIFRRTEFERSMKNSPTNRLPNFLNILSTRLLGRGVRFWIFVKVSLFLTLPTELRNTNLLRFAQNQGYNQGSLSQIYTCVFFSWFHLIGRIFQLSSRRDKIKLTLLPLSSVRLYANKGMS